jgi:hypothetical protein
VSGPYETERQAADAALELGGPPDMGWSILGAGQNHQMLIAACEAAGVSLGAYDSRILAWLAGFEDSACAVVAGLITRAHAAGQDPGGPGTAQPGGGWISGPST